MDRIRYLREPGSETAARLLAAQPHNFVDRPTDPERFYEMLADPCARRAGRRPIYHRLQHRPPGRRLLRPGRRHGAQELWRSRRLYDADLDRREQRDAHRPRRRRDRLVRQICPRRAVAAGRDQGLVLGRARRGAGRRLVDATSHFERAAATPDYSTASWRSNGSAARSPVRPACRPFQVSAAAARRVPEKRLVRAVRQLGQQGQRADQSLFIRALSELAETPNERVLASKPRPRSGAATSRCGPPGRRATPDRPFTRGRLPDHSLGRSRRTASGRWSMASPARKLVRSRRLSHVGARGMMQLMPGTAARAGGQDGHRLRRFAPDVRSQLQRHARQRLFPAAARPVGRQLSAGGRQLQRRRGQRPQMDPRLWRPARRPAPT